MLCPVCNLDAVRINAVEVTETDENGKEVRYMVNTYSCRNKRCREFQKEVGEDKIPLDDEPTE